MTFIQRPNVPLQNFPVDPGRYFNSVQIRSSIWEVTLDLFHSFAPAGEQVAPPQMMNQLVVRAVMSPQQAKALALALTRTVEGWVAENGPLPDVDAIVGQIVKPDAPDVTDSEETK